MPLTSRIHLGKQEEAVDETGVQIRGNEPANPVSGQAWINTSERKLKVQDGSRKLVLAEGGISDAINIPSNDIVDLNVSRSFFKQVTSNFDLINIINSVQGNYATIRFSNPSPAVAQVFEATLPSPMDMTDGNYWRLNSANDATEYFVWYDFDGLEQNDPSSLPALDGMTGVKVVVTPGRKQLTDFVAEFGNNISSGSYFRIFDADNIEHIVWYNVDNGGGDPTALGNPEEGKESIQIVIDGVDDDTVVAVKSADEIATYPEFNATSSGNIFTVENAEIGASDDAVDVSIGGNFSITVTVVGVAADTDEYAANQTALALDALVDFNASNTGNVLSVENTSDGFTQDPSTGDMPVGFALTVIDQGSGQVTVSFPSSVALSSGATGVIPATSEKVFTLFPISGQFLTSADTYSL